MSGAHFSSQDCVANAVSNKFWVEKSGCGCRDVRGHGYVPGFRVYMGEGVHEAAGLYVGAGVCQGVQGCRGACGCQEPMDAHLTLPHLQYRQWLREEFGESPLRDAEEAKSILGKYKEQGRAEAQPGTRRWSTFQTLPATSYSNYTTET